MATRTPSNRAERSQLTGPMERDELDVIFERGYSIPTRRFLATAWDAGEEASADAVWGAMGSETIESKLARVEPLHIALLAEVIAQGGRLRAENARKEMLLRGLGEPTEELRALIRDGLLFVVPGSGQADMEIEHILEQRAFLQQEVALPVSVFVALREREIGASDEEVGAWSGEVASTRSESMQSLEINVLHLANGLEKETLRLNKSGAPNKRSLAKFISGITRPATSEVAEPWLDATVPEQADYLAFLFALSRELGLTRADVSAQTLSGQKEGIESYFILGREQRGRRLLQTVQNLKGWSETFSPASGATPSSEQILDDQLSQLLDNGAPLIGARGYIASVLRRAHFQGWTPLEAVIDLCVNLDRDYLPRVLGKLEHSPDIHQYARSFITRPLFWVGAVELGRSSRGEELMRLTEYGKFLLGLNEEMEEPYAEKGCLFIQPNMEAMVFLDAAPMEMLYRLYQLGRRVNLADRVASFKLDAESVQRGYSQGLDAEQAIELLQNNSHAPIADNITFELRNWERVWKRLTLWAQGTLIRHEDPDKLDSILSQIKHAFRDHPDFRSERLAAGSVMIWAPDDELLFEQLKRDRGVRHDYTGEISPSLEVVDGLRFAYSPLTCDVETAFEIKRLGEEDKQASSARRRVVELTAHALERRWPQESLSHALGFLRTRIIGGLPAEQEIQLRALLARPPVATLRRGVFVVTMEDTDGAALFERTDHASGAILAKIGETSFIIDEDYFDEVSEMMERLGVVVEIL